MVKGKEAYQLWLPLHRNFPRVERMGIGQKIESQFLSFLELCYGAVYLPPEPKILQLGKAISRLDMLRFFLELARENALIPLEKHVELLKHLNESGRQLGGWKRGLEQKLSPRNGERKR